VNGVSGVNGMSKVSGVNGVRGVNGMKGVSGVDGWMDEGKIARGPKYNYFACTMAH
jgi:hypothetical protein